MKTVLHESESDIDRLKRQLEHEAKQRAWLESLLAESLRYQYIDRVACPPTWIAEAQLATQR